MQSLWQICKKEIDLIRHRHTIVIVLRPVLPMVMVARGGGGRRAGGMKTHVREDHPGLLQEDHHISVTSVRRPYIGVHHDGRFFARE